MALEVAVLALVALEVLRRHHLLRLVLAPQELVLQALPLRKESRQLLLINKE